MSMTINSRLNAWEELPLSLDPQTVAQIFGINERTVRNLAGSGELKSFRIGRQLRFNRDYIRAVVEGNVLQDSELN